MSHREERILVIVGVIVLVLVALLAQALFG
jgi:hypothetical protein